MLGDCYAAAVVEALSSKELSAMDAVSNKKENLEKIVVENQETEALIGPKVMSPSECSNESRNIIDEVEFFYSHYISRSSVFTLFSLGCNNRNFYR